MRRSAFSAFAPRPLVLFIAVWLLRDSPATAAPFVFEQAPGDLNAPSAVSDVLQGRQAFDDFVLPVDVKNVSLRWFGRVWPRDGVQFDPRHDELEFVVAFHYGDSFTPELQPFFSMTSGADVRATSDPYTFEFRLVHVGGLDLPALNLFWLSIFKTTGDFEYSWLFAGYQPGVPVTGLSYSRLIGGGGDVTNAGDLAFAIAAPEPATLASMVLGLAAVAVIRRRGRRFRGRHGDGCA